MNNKSTINILKKILKKNNLPGDKIIKLAGGQSNIVYDVGDHIVRISGSDKASQRLKKEVQILSQLSSSQYIAKLVDSGEIDESFFQLQTKILGQPLIKIWKDIDLEKKRTIIGEISDALSQIHSICEQRDLDPKEYFMKSYQESLGYMQQVEMYIPIGLLDELKKQIEALSCNSIQTSLIHGDLWLGNILVDDTRLSGIIDWEAAEYLPAYFELASLETSLLYPNDYLEENESFVNYADVILLLRGHYPGLFPNREQRRILDIYQAVTALRSHVNFMLRSYPNGIEKYYPVNPIAKITNFVFDEGARAF